MEHKAHLAAQLKFSADGSGTLQGYASAFGGVDSYADQIEPGAYRDTIPEFLAAGFLADNHDWSRRIGFPTLAREDGHGLYLEGAFHSTPEAQSARTVAAERLAARKSVGLSIGYEAEAWEMRRVETPVRNQWGEFTDKVRVLTQIKLYEVSLVSVPADAQALATGVKATWTSSYVNDLPDSAFALIEPGGSKDDEGKTTPRSLRHFPHHDAGGSLDPPHLRNALARLPQSSLSDALKAKAERHLDAHAAAEDVGKGHVHDWDALLAELKAGARNSSADLARIQSAHDLLAELGAQCAEPKAHAPDPELSRLFLETQRTFARLRGVAV